ncbi:MAG: type I glyceraldehyde-3-phosphate dehydrogenase [Firmicutes bacterium]|nr:type I glyceraldehyde-3-phosphate dehydrogenase [Bacillota bacterium]
MIRVAINGFGRIGRIAFRQMITSTDFDIVAINSLGASSEEFAYLVKYDTVHGTFHEDEIGFENDELVICGQKRIKVLSESDPSKLPWANLNVDLVLECTGAFTNNEGAMKHISAGAKKVLISAPGKDEMPTIVAGVNDMNIPADAKVVSAASCTTNCLAPILKVINDNIGIVKGYMTTVHAYTSDQVNLDNTHKKGINSRRGRACAENIVPASTGAAKAIGLVIPDLKGKMDGIAFRVPVADGSVVDTTLELKRNVSVEEINNLFINNQSESLKITFDPIVSCDVIGKKYGSVVDGLSTSIVETEGRQLVKVIAWYDNEYGYTAQMLRTAKKMFS